MNASQLSAYPHRLTIFGLFLPLVLLALRQLRSSAREERERQGPWNNGPSVSAGGYAAKALPGRTRASYDRAPERQVNATSAASGGAIKAPVPHCAGLCRLRFHAGQGGGEAIAGGQRRRHLHPVRGKSGGDDRAYVLGEGLAAEEGGASRGGQPRLLCTFAIRLSSQRFPAVTSTGAEASFGGRKSRWPCMEVLERTTVVEPDRLWATEVVRCWLPCRVRLPNCTPPTRRSTRPSTK